MCLALGADGLDRRTLLGRLARLGGSAAALTALGPVVWAQSGNDAPLPAEVANVKLPLSALVLKAAREVAAVAPPVIYFHSVRTFVLASLYADLQKWTFDRELVMLASLFHDIGLTVARELPDRHFEEVSAERAREFVVREGGFSAGDADLVYRGIALHFGKAQNQPEPEVRLIQIGAGIDLFSKNSPGSRRGRVPDPTRDRPHRQGVAAPPLQDRLPRRAARPRRTHARPRASCRVGPQSASWHRRQSLAGVTAAKPHGDRRGIGGHDTRRSNSAHDCAPASAAMPGSVRPSSHSRNAPPAVET